MVSVLPQGGDFERADMLNDPVSKWPGSPRPVAARPVAAAVATVLLDQPVAAASALIVVVCVTEIGTVYVVEAAVGVLPSVV